MSNNDPSTFDPLAQVLTVSCEHNATPTNLHHQQHHYQQQQQQLVQFNHHQQQHQQQSTISAGSSPPPAPPVTPSSGPVDWSSLSDPANSQHHTGHTVPLLAGAGGEGGGATSGTATVDELDRALSRLGMLATGVSTPHQYSDRGCFSTAAAATASGATWCTVAPPALRCRSPPLPHHQQRHYWRSSSPCCHHHHHRRRRRRHYTMSELHAARRYAVASVTASASAVTATSCHCRCSSESIAHQQQQQQLVRLLGRIQLNGGEGQPLTAASPTSADTEHSQQQRRRRRPEQDLRDERDCGDEDDDLAGIDEDLDMLYVSWSGDCDGSGGGGGSGGSGGGKMKHRAARPSVVLGTVGCGGALGCCGSRTPVPTHRCSRSVPPSTPSSSWLTSSSSSSSCRHRTVSWDSRQHLLQLLPQSAVTAAAAAGGGGVPLAAAAAGGHVDSDGVAVVSLGCSAVAAGDGGLVRARSLEALPSAVVGDKLSADFSLRPASPHLCHR